MTMHQATNSPTLTVDRQQAQPRRTDSTVHVSQLSDAEIEAHIRSLSELIVLAHRLGDRGNARELQRCMYEAIALRNPARKAAMDAEIQRAIDEGPDYFQVEGAKARASMSGRAG